MDLSAFLEENEYIDYSAQIIQDKTDDLLSGIATDANKALVAYEFVRDEIAHSFDINAKVITAKASDVLRYKTGICHAKANLLAAMLRSVGIPVGFCFQHITLAEDESLGYCVHCYNAIFIENRWIKVDARGNTNGKDAQFSLNEPQLAYPNRPQFDEYFWPGIYARPHMATMQMLERAKTLQDILDNIPDYVLEAPDIYE